MASRKVSRKPDTWKAKTYQRVYAFEWSFYLRDFKPRKLSWNHPPFGNLPKRSMGQYPTAKERDAAIARMREALIG